MYIFYIFCAQKLLILVQIELFLVQKPCIIGSRACIYKSCALHKLRTIDTITFFFFSWTRTLITLKLFSTTCTTFDQKLHNSSTNTLFFNRNWSNFPAYIHKWPLLLELRKGHIRDLKNFLAADTRTCTTFDQKLLFSS